MKQDIAEYFVRFDKNLQKRFARVRETLLDDASIADESIREQIPSILWDETSSISRPSKDAAREGVAEACSPPGPGHRR